MTLVEVMVGTTIFIMCALGVYAALIKSYQLSALSRCREEARAVLRTFADQFERLQTSVEDTATKEAYTRWLFFVEGTTGRGLVWPGISDTDTRTSLPNVEYLEVQLGTKDAPVIGRVTRTIEHLNTANGTVAAYRQIEAAGYMLQGTFSITYKINNNTYTESLSVARSVP